MHREPKGSKSLEKKGDVTASLSTRQGSFCRTKESLSGMLTRSVDPPNDHRGHVAKVAVSFRPHRISVSC